MAVRPGGSEPPGAAALLKGFEILAKHPGFRHIKLGQRCTKPGCERTPARGLASINSNGFLHVNPWSRAEPEEWAWAIAHAQLHLGLGHIPAAAEPDPAPDAALAAARCVVVNRFLEGFKVGSPPFGHPNWPEGDEHALAQLWRVAPESRRTSPPADPPDPGSTTSKSRIRTRTSPRRTGSRCSPRS